MTIGLPAAEAAAVAALRTSLDQWTGRYQSLRGVRSFGRYLATPGDRADEELLTEPALDAILRDVLGFPPDAYFPQLGRGGLKPDFTPIDLIAHPFVLDAKASDERLDRHEPQIRRYIDQRALDYGVLFNLHEMRVYRRSGSGHDPALSFALAPLWAVARGEALPGPETAALAAFLRVFAYRESTTAQKIAHLRSQRSWNLRMQAGEHVQVDVDFLTERLRSLSRMLTDDAAGQTDRLAEHLDFNPARGDRLVQELRLLALDIAPGTPEDQLPGTSEGWWTSEDDLTRRVWRQYLLRVAYLSLTRILLYRAWEDVGFVDDHLYDGGFDAAYARLDSNVQRVLREAFAHGAERYRWLFGPDNNYDWYRPRDDALVEVLYTLGQFPLGTLDADVLGGLYQSYVDAIDRDRLGQFFTPRSVVRFMLDRAGFRGAAGVFRLEGDHRRPRRVYDFATGSGGFLVEAARRIIDDGGVREDDARGLTESLQAVVSGLTGSEISPFPYYLTEVNLLLQVSRIMGRLNLLGRETPPFTLGVLHMDSLAARLPDASSIEGLAGHLRRDAAELSEDARFGLVPLDGDKRATFERLRTGGFDLVVGNPPYVAESNNKPLFDRLRALDAWRDVYRGKTDYLYYFLLLAVEKLAPGGRLCVIVPASWMNAGAAGFLRERLANDLRLDELFLFGSARVFAPDTPERRRRVPTPTVEVAILVATRGEAPAGHRLRVVVLEDEAAAAAALSGDPSATRVDRETLLDEMTRRVALTRPGRRDGIAVLDVPQADLAADRPWPVKHQARDVAARVVATIERGEDRQPIEPLDRAWHIFQGIQTGADAWTRRIDRRLGDGDRRALREAGAALGDPVLELPAGDEAGEPWASHPQVLVRSCEPRAILYGTVDAEDYTSLVVIRGTEAPPAVERHLARWRPLLETRAEMVRNARRRWWEATWPRDATRMAAPKVICLHRTDRGRFALDESGTWQPSIKTTLVVGRETTAPVAYLCGLLNSELLDLWYAIKGRNPRDIWRDYEPSPMARIPYRRPEGDLRAEQVAELVRRMGANRRALLPHRALFPGLRRTVKSPWDDRVPPADLAAAMAALPPDRALSVRIHPDVTATVGEPPYGRPRRIAPDAIALRRGRVETGRIAGPVPLMDVLEATLPAVEDPLLAPVPIDPADVDRLLAARRREVGELLAEGRKIVERIERLVCSLYGLPDDLTDEVVASAVSRAGAVGGRGTDD